MQLRESQRLTQWSVFSKEEGIGPLALVSVAGSVDGQHESPFPKEQEQQLVSGIEAGKSSGSFVGAGFSSNAVLPGSDGLWFRDWPKPS